MSQNKPLKANKAWTSDENKKLADIVVELVSKGTKFSDAYKQAGEELGRSEYAVEKQWRTNLKQKYVSKIVKNTKGAAKTVREVAKTAQEDAAKVFQQITDRIEKATSNKEIKSLNDSMIESGSVEEAEQIAKSAKHFKKIDGVETFADVLGFLQKLAPKNVPNLESLFKTQPVEQKPTAYDGREKATPKEGTTKLAALRKSIETFESEKLRVLNSGKDGYEYIVINNEEDKGYLVKVDGDKVVDCNCPHHQYRGVICKHMIKVAFDKNLEVF